MTRLVIPKICRDCGDRITTLEELDTHDLHCPGPIRLVFIDEGDPVAEVGSD